MIKREIAETLGVMAGQFKALAITGPRQSGKTTLAKMTFPDKPYVSLEWPDELDRALRDPRHFLGRFPDGCILDEVQRAPELFSYLQGILDESAQPGRFILTGSQQFGLMEKITQSLAGRIGMLELMPFGFGELSHGSYADGTLDEVMWRGGYPPIFDQQIDPRLWYDSYITTYVERDVRQLLNVKDLATFGRFLGLCAGNIGQLVNATRIGSDCGIDQGSVRNWLSVLEASYITFRLQPHHRNYRKRLVKTPKIYFRDVGLACRLLGIESASQLSTHPLRGSIFENWVVVELLKSRLNKGFRSNLFFWRNNTGLEVDLLADSAGKLMPVEIKSGATIATDWFKGLDNWLELAGNEAVHPRLIYGGDQSWAEGTVGVIPWRKIADVSELL